MSRSQWWYEKLENVAQKREKPAFCQKNQLLERENEKTGFSGEKVASHHPTTFLTMKIGSNKNRPKRMHNEGSGAKTRSSGPRK